MCPAPRGTGARPPPAAGAGGACRRAPRASAASHAPGSRPPARPPAPPAPRGRGTADCPARARTPQAQSPAPGPGACCGELGVGGWEKVGVARRGSQEIQRNSVRKRVAEVVMLRHSNNHTLPTQRNDSILGLRVGVLPVFTAFALNWIGVLISSVWCGRCALVIIVL